MNIEKQYYLLSKDVQKFTLRLTKFIKTNSSIEEYYKGVQIMFSPLHYRPCLLLLGINPGAGYYFGNNKIVKRYKPLREHEYFKYEYTLANEMKHIFSKINMLKILKNSVKSNYYYIATNNEAHLKCFIKNLDFELREQFMKKTEEWNYELITLIRPKIILCEGFNAFNHLINNQSFKFNKIANSKNWKYAEANDLKIISCQRIYSNIINKDSFAKKLNTVIDSI